MRVAQKLFLSGNTIPSSSVRSFPMRSTFVLALEGNHDEDSKPNYLWVVPRRYSSMVLVLYRGWKILQFSATDVSDQTTRRGAANCDKQCDLKYSVVQQAFDRILRFRDIPKRMPARTTMRAQRSAISIATCRIPKPYRHFNVHNAFTVSLNTEPFVR